MLTSTSETRTNTSDRLWDTRTDDPAILLRSVRKRFGGASVLDDVSLEIEAGEVFVVLGPSGSGKTTILRIIAGLEHPDEGEVRLGGVVANGFSPQERNIGVVLQEHALFHHMTVEKNIAFGLEIRRVPAATIRTKVGEMLDLTRLETTERSSRPSCPADSGSGSRSPAPW